MSVAKDRGLSKLSGSVMDASRVKNLVFTSTYLGERDDFVSETGFFASKTVVLTYSLKKYQSQIPDFLKKSGI